ncbi:hypothetical protein ACQCWD_27220 [Bacillus thuringiensis]|uniref:Uncharacterized protein n=1 Tax=Bacillus cereus TaxID=1396 RepID=A0AAN5XKH8_BACCE|nr:hypothetical protein [Bacillus cereus]KAB2446093.1 hypothetical protein F8165_28695 [Bacillus cereus]
MEETFITSYAKLELAYKYKFITIDIANKFFMIHVIKAKTKEITLITSMDLFNDEIVTEGNIDEYPYDIEEVIDSLKVTADLCIENNLLSQLDIGSYIEELIKKKTCIMGHHRCPLT